MKPLPGDYRHKLLISGAELKELKEHTASMAEAFGLDRKIENYKGSRPITLYRWDLECLIDVIDLALQDERQYPDKSAQEYLALKCLGVRLHQEYNTVYGDEKTPKLSQTAAQRKKVTPSSPVRATGHRAKTPKTVCKDNAVYQLKITLTDLQPSIWRRVEVEDCTLLRLHKIIQVCMGWDNYHVWAFEIGDEEYGDDVIDSGGDRDFTSARKYKLNQVVQAGIERFHYIYDFGDNWVHLLQIEKVLVADKNVKYPRCIKGSRSAPPEDCGGPWGYEKFLDAIADPQHERHDDMLDWVGDEFDPEAFDVEAVNKSLSQVR